MSSTGAHIINQQHQSS